MTSRRERVLVTGAGGFIGSHLVERLLDHGYPVRALVHYNSRNDRGWLEALPAESDLEVVSGDIRDAESVARAAADVDVVFHLAALIAIPYSYVNPRGYFETNVLGTLNVAQACLAHGTRLIHTSTSEVYGTAQVVPITENHPVVGQSPYSASKIGADHLIESFYRTYELPATIVRPFNTYGPRQSARAVIPTIISQALTGEVVRLGSLTPSRDLTFATDTAEGFIRAAESASTVGQTLQLGTGSEITVGELVEEIGAILGQRLEVIEEDARRRPKESEVMRLVSDHSRFTELTGWRPAVSLHEGLERTIAWMRDNPGAIHAEGYVI